MEENILKDLMEKMQGEKLGSRKNDTQMWYNEEGDCIQFQTEHVAIIRDRIDDYLTIYRSAVNKGAIGFQLKDIKALMRKYYFDNVVVTADVRNNKLISITALLVSILSDSILMPSISRREGYVEALRTFPKERDKIPLLFL